MSYRWQLPAPGDLETVRVFLNTLVLAGRAHAPRDTLSDLLASERTWQEQFPDVRRGAADTEARLRELRADLREALSGAAGSIERLDRWLRDLPLIASMQEDKGGPVVRLDPPPEAGLAGRLLAIVVSSMQEGTWSRLKACPDCQVVFYDHTRSRTKVWCGMLAGGPEGRACGTIAKVTRYRQRQRVRAVPQDQGSAGAEG